jgi:aminoglycoside phosphotransferase (APT) family kinase protein
MIHLPPELTALLRSLSTTPHDQPHTWGAWTITPIYGGANNRLVRAVRPAADLAVKWTIRDDRDRAGREAGALAALQALGLDLAPSLVFLDRTSYPLPVVVQTWLPGETLDVPNTDAAWEALVAHYAAIHQVTPARLAAPLPNAVLSAASADAARQLVWAQMGRVPDRARPAVLQSLVARLDAWRMPVWVPTAPCLLRCDPHIRNFVRQGNALASVDWENSGWGDPAFEIADLIVHPSYLGITPARWAWVCDTYARMSPDQGVQTRITTYRVCLLVWWVARLARMVYEVPRGLDERLVVRPADWEAETARKLDYYAAASNTALHEVGA